VLRLLHRVHDGPLRGRRRHVVLLGAAASAGPLRDSRHRPYRKNPGRGMTQRRVFTSAIPTVFATVALSLLALAFAFPFVWMLGAGFKADSEIFTPFPLFP